MNLFKLKCKFNLYLMKCCVKYRFILTQTTQILLIFNLYNFTDCFCVHKYYLDLIITYLSSYNYSIIVLKYAKRSLKLTDSKPNSLTALSNTKPVLTGLFAL